MTWSQQAYLKASNTDGDDNVFDGRNTHRAYRRGQGGGLRGSPSAVSQSYRRIVGSRIAGKAGLEVWLKGNSYPRLRLSKFRLYWIDSRDKAWGDGYSVEKLSVNTDYVRHCLVIISRRSDSIPMTLRNCPSPCLRLCVCLDYRCPRSVLT